MKVKSMRSALTAAVAALGFFGLATSSALADGNYAWRTNEYFKADASTGACVNGEWVEAPSIEGNVFKIDSTQSVFVVTEDKQTEANNNVKIECDLTIDEYYYQEDLAADVPGAIAGISLVTNEAAEGSVSWAALVNNEWTELTGGETGLGSYTVRTELDYDSNLVRYSVKKSDGSWVTLKDGDTTWFTASAATHVTNVVFSGKADVAGFNATLSTEATALVDGIDYESVEAALAAAKGAEEGDPNKAIYLYKNGAVDAHNLKPYAGLTFDFFNVADTGSHTVQVNASDWKKSDGTGVTAQFEDGKLTVSEETDLVAAIGYEDNATAYFTLAEAYTNATDTLVLMANTTISETLAIDKALLFDLGGNTLTFHDAIADFGIQITVDDVVVSNGLIETDFTGYKTGFKALCFDGVSGVAAGLDLTIPGADYGVTAWLEPQEEAPAYTTARKTVVCQDVSVNGNGALFYAEHANMTLDENCAGYYEGALSPIPHHRCAVYSTANSLITIMGGNYSVPEYVPEYDENGKEVHTNHADVIHIGDYASSLKIESGDFTGNIKSYMSSSTHTDLRETYPDAYKGTIEIIYGSFETYSDDLFDVAEMPCAFVTWAVKGGSFQTDPSAYLAPGYYAEYDGYSYQVNEKGGVEVVSADGITTNYYGTIAEALEEVEADGKMTFLKDFTLDETLVMETAFTLDLNGTTLTYSDAISCYGIKVTADGATVQNGKIATDFTSYKTKFQALCFNCCGGTAKDLTLNIPNADYGVIAECDGSSPYQTPREDLPYITCENVKVTGNGALFYAEAANMTLNADCGATWEDPDSECLVDDHRCAIYSTYNAQITVAGGTYDATGANAFHFGNYATSVHVTGGAFYGDLWNSTGNEHADLYPAEYQATLEIEGGSFDGNFIQPETPSPKQVWSITGGDFTDDPAPYMADGYYAVGGDGFWEVADSGFTAAVGKYGYCELADAITAAAGERDVVLFDDCELESLDVEAAIDMNGNDLSITGDTLDYDLTVRDRTGSDSRLSAEGTKYINADLDLSPLAYKQIAGHTGVFVIASGCTVLLAVDESVKDLAKTGMFDGSAVGAMVVTEDGQATFDGVLWLAEGETAFAGAGTLEDPYQIKSEDDLLNLAAYTRQTNYLDKCFEQKNDITLTGEWKGIGAFDAKDNLGNSEVYTNAAFQGVFNGANYTISGLILQRGDYVGFFGSTYNATIKNVKIELGNETGFGAAENGTAGSAGGVDYGGGVIVGVSVNTTIEDCETIAGTHGNFVATKGLGGIVGFAAGGTVLKSCVNNVNVKTANEKAGGLIACVQNNSKYAQTGITIDTCTNNGNIECTTSGKTRVGGLASYADSVITFKGANAVTGTLTQNGGEGYSLASPNSGSIVVADGASFTVPAAYKTVYGTKGVDGLFFATVSGDTATLVKNASVVAGGSYKVMAENAPTITLSTLNDTITIDTSLATVTVETSAEGCEVTKNGDDYTVTAKSHNITYVYTTNSVSVAAEELVGLVNNAQTTFTELEDVEIETNKILLAGFKVVSADPSGWTAGAYEADVEVTIAFEKVESGKSVAPGGAPLDVQAESAEAATNGVEVVVSSPDETIVSDEDYKDYFYVHATDLGGGSYRLTAQLKPEIKQAADETEQIADGLGDIAAGEASAIQIENAKPGLWYSVIYSDSVSSMTGSMVGALEGDRAQAQADGSVTIHMPKMGVDPTQQFYQVQVNTADKGIVQ